MKKLLVALGLMLLSPSALAYTPCGGATSSPCFNTGSGTAGSPATNPITVQGIASMTPILSAESGTWNITNISGTISLPTGAATSAKQPALGTAGTASSDVLTIQGIASMTPLTVTVSGTATISGAVTANAGTNLNTSLLALESGGNLATLAGSVSSSVMQSNTKQVNGVTTLAGAGAVGTGSQRVAVGQDTTTIAGSAPGTAGSASANVVTVQGVASMTPVQVSQSGTWTVQPGNTANTTPWLTQSVGQATGGISVSSKQVANNTTSVAIDTSAGTLYGVTVFNNSATIAYLKLYNASQGSTTCGSGTPVQRILIPANTNGAGAVIPFPVGIAYGTAITSCVTTGFADNDSTAPAASAYLIEFYFK
jgi:hypothetical protein